MRAGLPSLLNGVSIGFPSTSTLTPALGFGESVRSATQRAVTRSATQRAATISLTWRALSRFLVAVWPESQ